MSDLFGDPEDKPPCEDIPGGPSGNGIDEAFWAVSSAGRRLAELHLNYEDVEPWPLVRVETGVVSYRVEKMVLSADRTAVRVNETLTLKDIPPDVFRYMLGNKSALEWVLDQYQITEDPDSGIRSDPNRADDPEYIVRLVGQVVAVSLETVDIQDMISTIPYGPPRVDLAEDGGGE